MHGATGASCPRTLPGIEGLGAIAHGRGSTADRGRDAEVPAATEPADDAAPPSPVSHAPSDVAEAAGKMNPWTLAGSGAWNEASGS